MDEQQKGKLEQRLDAIHKRVQWMADGKARAAWVEGHAASGEFLKEKSKLLDEAEALLDRLEEKPR